MEDNINVKNFYENNYDEDAREGRETLEFVRSKLIIARYLAESPMDIADVGGATGAYSFWLAEMGHRVHLLDLAANHIAIAQEKSRENGLALAAYDCADARALPYSDASLDTVLLMGALYHLHSREDRVKCLAEAYRVLRPGGLIVCTVMCRYNILIAAHKYGFLDSYGKDAIELDLKTGIFEKANFYGHTPAEIVDEMTAAGFEGLEQIAVEGIANALGDNKIPANEKEAQGLLWSIQQTESVPELIGVSRNIITVGRKR